MPEASRERIRLTWSDQVLRRYFPNIFVKLITCNWTLFNTTVGKISLSILVSKTELKNHILISFCKLIYESSWMQQFSYKKEVISKFWIELSLNIVFVSSEYKYHSTLCWWIWISYLLPPQPNNTGPRKDPSGTP